jgi:hypothetical protein
MLTPRGARILRTSLAGLWLPALLPVLAAPHLVIGAQADAERAPQAQVGLRVHPPVMLVRDVIPGEEAVTQAPITVENSGTRPIKCTVGSFAPSTIGMRTMRGYTDIPEPSWCTPAGCTLVLDPGESRSFPVSIMVPDERCYENRSWCVAFSVQTEGAGTLGAAAYPYIYIETTTKQDTPRPLSAADGARALPKDSPRGTGINLIEGRSEPLPQEDGATVRRTDPYPRVKVETQRAQQRPRSAGCLGISCGVLDAGDVAAGDTASAGTIIVENRYGEDVRVEIRPLVPEPDRIARNVLLTPGHTWIEDEGWLHTWTRGVNLLAGKTAHFEMVVASPISPSTHNYRWEGFIEVAGPHGPEAIVRVRWRTTSPPAIVRAPDGGG